MQKTDRVVHGHVYVVRTADSRSVGNIIKHIVSHDFDLFTFFILFSSLSL